MDNTTQNITGSIEVPRSSVSSTGVTAPAVTLAVTPAGLADATAVIDVIAGAFLNDPAWSWAFPEPAARRRWWTHCIEGALRYPWAFKTSGFEAICVWIPPDGTEFSHDGEQRIPALLNELVGSRAPEVAELLGRFDRAHPRHAPHYYLSLLATAGVQRGRGLGIALLKESLARIDASHMPAYLESSNPANNQRYEALGFVPVVCFRAPGDGPIVTGMWRQEH